MKRHYPMNSAGPVHRLFLSDRRLQWMLLVFMVLCYGIILSHAGLHRPARPMNRTFNSMLEHLVHGRFDVDPNVIGVEGFLHNGRVNAYWGITCALLRLPLFLVNRLDLDVTAWSCLVAVCLAGMMKIRTVLFIRRHCGIGPGSEWAFILMLVYIVLGGAEVGYLKSSVYQEVVFWAIAFAAIFVYFAVKGLVIGEFTLVTLSWMAMAAGLATLTRVSTGLGLCMAFGLLLLVLVVEDTRARRVAFLRFLVPAVVLGVFLIVVGAVNYFRWGNPTTFTDYTHYILNLRDPDRMLQMQTNGLFNVARIPFGFIYYFLPLWSFQGVDGRLFFQSTQTRMMDLVELPPSSFFLTDLLPIAFIVFLAMALWSSRSLLLRKGARSEQAANSLPFSGISALVEGVAVAVGLAVPCILMLMAMCMCYRYRMEFYPEIDFLAFLGLYATVRNSALLALFDRCRGWMLAATVTSIVSAFTVVVLYNLAPFGTLKPYLRNGFFQYYLHSPY